MPAYVVSKVVQGLNARKKPINGSRILMLGIAYKKNVDDMRESPSVEIMQQMQQHGALVEYSDPHVPVFPRMRRYRFDLKSVDLTAERLADYDCVVVGTNHDAFDYAMISQHARLIVDTRGVYRGVSDSIVAA